MALYQLLDAVYRAPEPAVSRSVLLLNSDPLPDALQLLADVGHYGQAVELAQALGQPVWLRGLMQEAALTLSLPAYLDMLSAVPTLQRSAALQRVTSTELQRLSCSG